jgi:ribosome maturation protein SDO1
MVTVEDAVIAKYEKGGKHFEVLVDPELSYDLRSGKPVSIQKMLAVNAVFKDAKKGMRASPSEMQEVFNTQVIEEVAKIIVKEGEVQLTTSFKNKKIEEKKKQIAAFISKNAINPQTGLPHPIDRILNVIDKVGIDIDPFKPASQQTEKVIKAIKSMLPLSLEQIKIYVRVPAKYAGRAYGLIKEYGSEGEWLNDGSVRAIISIPAGMKEELFHRFGSITEGNAEIREEK